MEPKYRIHILTTAQTVLSKSSIRENFNPPASLKFPVPFICPGIHLIAFQAYESLGRVKKLADLILPIHGPSLVDSDAFEERTRREGAR